MKALVSTGAAAIALLASAPGTSAAPITFGFTGGIETFTVPQTGTYDIVATGARGGNTSGNSLPAPGNAGLGAQVGGDFILAQNTFLQIAVGGMGGEGCCGTAGAGAAS